MKPIPHKPICPKCGYDQSGAIATWESQCPMWGVCPECGLEFAWVEVFQPMFNDLRWYTEHARSVWSLLWRTPKTLMRLILPPLFWRELDVKKRLSIPMLTTWCVLVCFITHLIVAVPVGLEHWQERNWTSMTPRQYIEVHGLSGALSIAFNGVAQPLYEAFPNERGYARTIDVAIRPDRWDADYFMDIFFRPIGFQLGFIALWLVVLLAIPRTRRMTKLRGAHIARTALLSATAMVLTFELYRFNIALHGLGGSRTGVTYFMYNKIVPLLIVWQIVFWACAIAIGWRIRPWRLLVVLGTLAALLGGATLRVYVFLLTTL